MANIAAIDIKQQGGAKNEKFKLETLVRSVGANLQATIRIRDEHGPGLDRTGSGLNPILAGSGLDRTAIFLKIGGSGLDRTEKIFFVLMWLFRTYQKF